MIPEEDFSFTIPIAQDTSDVGVAEFIGFF
jgi:hypothetical protein